MALCRHFVKGSELFGEVKLSYMCSSAEDNAGISTGQEEGSQYLSHFQVWGKESLSFSMPSEILP